MGTDSWFRNPAAQVSAHYGVSLSGAIHQYVDLSNTAWGNGILEAGNTWGSLLIAIGAASLAGINPNQLTVSIETEDLGHPGQDVTPAMFDSVLAACWAAKVRYPTIRALAGHNVISPQSRAHCPGERWRDSGWLTNLALQLDLDLF